MQTKNRSYDRDLYYLPNVQYYARVLANINCEENILVFSDEPKTAKILLRELNKNLIYIEGNDDYKDLYLMALCHDFICSCSTLSWWGAWLNEHNNKVIIVPQEGAFRPGAPRKADFF